MCINKPLAEETEKYNKNKNLFSTRFYKSIFFTLASLYIFPNAFVGINYHL